MQASTEKKSIVALVKCPNYQSESLKLALYKAFSLIGGLETIVKPGTKILLKPNIMMPKPPGHPANTHPQLIKAVAEIFSEAGGQVCIGESSAGSLAGLTFTTEALIRSGVKEIADTLNIPLINFDLAPVINKKIENPYAPVIPISRFVLEADLVVTIPKLKTHTYGTIITGAVKNCYGMIPGQIKAEFHRRAPEPRKFFTIVRDLFGVVKPRLAIMDAITAMEGDGPSAGNERQIGYLLVSSDPVAVDVVASELIGVAARNVLTNKLCAEAGLGAGDLESIDIKGENFKEAIIKDFKLPTNRIRNPLIYQLAISLTKKRPEINHKVCQLCNICRDSCPMQAISQENEKMVINYQTCIRCFCCSEVCPTHACRPKREHLIGELVSKIISSRW